MFQNHNTDNEGKFHISLKWTHTSLQFSGITFFFFLTGFPKSFCQMPTTNNPSLGVNSCNCANDCSHKRQPAIDVCVSSLHSPAFCFHQIKVYSKIRHYIALSLPMGNVTNLAMYIYIYIHTHTHMHCWHLLSKIRLKPEH